MEKEGTNSSKWLWIILVAVIIVVAGAICILYFYPIKKTKILNTQTNLITPTPTETASVTGGNIVLENTLPNNTTLIYADEIKDENGVGNRSYPIINLYEKIGSEKSNLIATVGNTQTKEFPSDYKLSLDKKSVYVNLETKLIKIDVASKKITNIVIAKESIGSFIFSQDGNQMLVWDQKYAEPDSNNYFLYQINLADNSIKTLKTGSQQNPYYLMGWRNDNKVITAEGLGDFSNYWQLDLNTLQFSKISSGVSEVSPSGAVIQSFLVVDPCSSYGGDTIGSYSLIDPINGKEILIKENGKEFNFVAFSPDNRSILFSSRPIRTSNDNCDNDIRPVEYFVYSADKKTSEKADLYTILEQWNEPNYGIGITSIGNTISYKNQDIIKTQFSEHSTIGNLDIIASYLNK